MKNKSKIKKILLLLSCSLILVSNSNAQTHSDPIMNTEISSNAVVLQLDQIHGYTYNGDSLKQLSVIAQEIELMMPEAVKTGSDGYQTVDYVKLSALLIQAVREQQATITSLENKIEQQNTTISDVKNVQKSLDERLLILEKK
jgi:uncharacterized GH25 family protein